MNPEPYSRDAEKENIWVSEDFMRQAMSMEVAYYKLRFHWLVKLGIKLKLIKI